MARVRHAVASTLAAAIALLSPRLINAQSCHAPSPQDPLEHGFRAAIAQETAHFRSSRYAGHYQGLMLRGSLTGRRFFAAAGLPIYRIVRNGLASRGFGDLSLHSRALLLSASGDTARGGLALSATFPTGDARHDLGMGHTMLMPGIWATASVDQFFAAAQITYANALASSDDAHHHGGAGPLVAPMSPSEIDATLSASLPIYPGLPGLRFKAGADSAVLVVNDRSGARANAFVGFWIGGRVKTSVELHLPIAGEPSTTSLVLELSVGLP
jgi:hypothetical protein